MIFFKNISFEKLVPFLMVIYFIAIMSSNALLQISSALLLITTIALLLTKKYNKDISVFKKMPKLLLYSLITFSISGVISLAFNVNNLDQFIDYLGDYRWVIQFFVLVILLNQFFKTSWIKKSHYIYIVAVVISIYAIWQSFTGLDLISGKHERLSNYGGMFRSIGTFGISLTLAYVYGVLFFSIFPQILVNTKSNSFRKKLFIGVSCLLFLAVIILTQTRGAWVAFVVTIFCVLIIYKPVRKYAVILLFISPLFYFVLPAQFQHRIKSITNVKTDTSNTGRFEIWTAHYNVFKKNKIIGVGMENNVKQLPYEYELMGIKKGKVLHAHNNILHIMSAQGLLGVVPFIIFQIIFFILAFNLIRYGINSEAVVVGLVSSAVQTYLFIGGLTEATFIDQEINHPLILTWALTLVIYLKNKHWPESLTA